MSFILIKQVYNLRNRRNALLVFSLLYFFKKTAINLILNDF
jgi:hypothetical protein